MAKRKPGAAITADRQLFQEKVAEEPKKSHEAKQMSGLEESFRIM